MKGNVDSIRLISISLGSASRNAAPGGCVDKHPRNSVTVSNKRPETVELRDINRDIGDETFLEFSLEEKN